MPEYQFQCRECRKVFQKSLSWTLGDDLLHQGCDCGAEADRVWNAPKFRIEWVNGGFHGDGINFGLGRHFSSVRERDRWAAEHGLVKADVDGVLETK